MRQLAVLPLAVLALGQPFAIARAEPLPLPSVDYVAEGTIMMGAGTLPGTMRHAGGKLRIDTAANGQKTTIYVDLATTTATIVAVQDGRKVAMRADARQMGGAVNAANIDARRVGEDQVAGERCVIYEFAVSPGRPLQACVTGDGIGLRSQERGQLMWQATRVTRAPQDPALFVVPADATPMQLPGTR